MHCRRVRSFLSAYYKGELSEKRSRAIADHLRNCPSCRREEQTVKEIEAALPRINQYSVSFDFNSRLLNRIAEERHAETRSKAYLPKRTVPVVNLTRISAVVAVACFVMAFIFAGGIEHLMPTNDQPTIAETVPSINDDYETVQPQSEHWVFKEQLQRATRIKDLMNQLSGESQFNTLTGYNGQNSNRRMVFPVPGEFFRLKPQGSPLLNGTVRPESTMVREVNAEG